MSTTATHLVVGAGPVGSTLARRLAAAGHDVVVVTRSGSGPEDGRITRVALDAGDARALAELAAGASALFNCANPPYHRWAQEWPPIADSMLSAAESSGAVLVTTSNLYAYGPVDRPMTPDLPLAAGGTKGRVRARMWEQALAAHQAGRVRAAEVRASDYLGCGAQSHLGDRVVPRLLAGKGVSVLGSADQPHSWSYVPDVVATLVAVASAPEAWGRAWHVPSAPPRTQREAVGDLCGVAGVPPVKVGVVPSVVLKAGGLFNPTFRELDEVLYQFRAPFVIDASATTRELGVEATPWDETLRSVVGWYRGAEHGHSRTAA